MPRLRRRFAIVVLALTAACRGEADSRPGLVLEQARPGVATGVYLNEPLVLHVSDDLDPLSVTHESVRIEPAEGGPPAAGALDVDGRRVRFRPRPALEPSLADGGFRPGTTYRVEIAGWPRVDGLRARDGRPLDRSYRWTFRTAERSEALFADQTPLSGAPLQLDRQRLGRDEPIRLACAEPLDPTTLEAGDFRLEFLSARRSAGASSPLVPLRARLVGNAEPGAADGGALLELWPETGGFQIGQYRLTIAPDTALRDYGGNLVWPSRAADAPAFRLVVVPRETELHESFLDAERRSPFLVPGVDGAAYWANGDWGTGASASPELAGKVTVRLPAAAGDGSDGRVVLGPEEGRRDVSAARLALPAGGRCELSAAGLVVLRSQGRLEVEGELVRRGDEAPPMTFASGLPLSTPPPPRRSPWRAERLSDWLRWARAEDPAWTVLVAGGDLVIGADARIHTEGPLLLAAGGRVVVLGDVAARDDQLFVLGEYAGRLPGKSYLVAMHIDAPLRNPLVEPLRVAAVSAPIPRWGGVGRWLSVATTEHDGVGSVRVRFLPETLDPLAASLEEWEPRSHPGDLPGGALRLLIELEVPPAPEEDRERSVWDPPFLDDVNLLWEPSAGTAR